MMRREATIQRNTAFSMRKRCENTTLGRLPSSERIATLLKDAPRHKQRCSLATQSLSKPRDALVPYSFIFARSTITSPAKHTDSREPRLRADRSGNLQS